MLRKRDWYLLGDIGGSNARFAAAAGGGIDELRVLEVQEYPRFEEALQEYLDGLRRSGAFRSLPAAACLAVAAPVDAQPLRFTNSSWVVDREALQGLLPGTRLALINDFAGIGHAVPALGSDDWEALGGGAPSAGEALAVLGPGTGLGVCTVVPQQGRYRVLAGEGGHVDFAPVDEREIDILRILWRRFGRVSAERLLCGDGLVQLYTALAELRGEGCPDSIDPAQVSAAGLAGRDALAVETGGVFIGALGAMAGNLALTVGARGGVYLAGGIAPRLLEALRRGRFRERFLDKGRFRSYLEPIPTRVIVHPQPALLGCLRHLEETDAAPE